MPRFLRRWSSPNGYRAVLAVALPLILSTSAWTVQHFVDRMFLTWYSPDAVAASMPAGMLSFALASFFIGTAGYAGTFVAQYVGAGRDDRCGPAVWQGVYLGLMGSLMHLTLIPFAGWVFDLIGHVPDVRANEVVYFRVLCLGAPAVMVNSALGGFFSGRGRTWPVMWVNVAGTCVNLVLDYVFIFGHWGAPRLGMLGAGAATTVAMYVQFVLYAALMGRPAMERRYRTLSGWRYEPALFRRLVRFGVPSGAQFFLDMAGFTAFVLMVGSLGKEALAATTIAFNINTLAFMPMIGVGMAVSILVGQGQGRGDPEGSTVATWSGFHIATAYMACVAAVYFFAPRLLLAPYEAGADAAVFAGIAATVVVLLRFVAVYSLFDSLNIIFSSALRGAGDTRFVMTMLGVVSLSVLVLPSYVCLIALDMGLYAGWVILSVYVVALGFSFLGRFLRGAWRHMRVIEEAPVVAPTMPEAPAGEA